MDFKFKKNKKFKKMTSEKEIIQKFLENDMCQI